MPHLTKEARNIQRRAYRKRVRKENPEKVRAAAKVKADQRRDRLIAKREKETGIKRPDRCSICGKKGVIVYDHCHETGEFRGWICNPCNLYLGLVKDDLGFLSKLVMYLRAFHLSLAYKRNGGFLKLKDLVETDED